MDKIFLPQSFTAKWHREQLLALLANAKERLAEEERLLGASDRKACLEKIGDWLAAIKQIEMDLAPAKRKSNAQYLGPQN